MRRDCGALRYCLALLHERGDSLLHALLHQRLDALGNAFLAEVTEQIRVDAVCHCLLRRCQIGVTRSRAKPGVRAVWGLRLECAT